MFGDKDLEKLIDHYFDQDEFQDGDFDDEDFKEFLNGFFEDEENIKDDGEDRSLR